MGKANLTFHGLSLHLNSGGIIDGRPIIGKWAASECRLKLNGPAWDPGWVPKARSAMVAWTNAGSQRWWCGWELMRVKRSLDLSKGSTRKRL